VGAAIRSLVLDRVSGYSVLVMLFAADLPVLLHSVPDARQRCGAVILLAAAVCGLLAPFVIDYLPQKLLRFRLGAELAALSHEGRRLFSLAGAVRGRSRPLRRHYGTYNPHLHAGGGESRVDLAWRSWVVIVVKLELCSLTTAMSRLHMIRMWIWEKAMLGRESAQSGPIGPNWSTRTQAVFDHARSATIN
jgi:hypothetical protein